MLLVLFLETAREFAASEAGLIPVNMRRKAFIWFVGALVLMALMHLSFTNDTADAVLSKGIELSPLAVGAMYAAGTAWDRYVRRPEDGDEEGG